MGFVVLEVPWFVFESSLTVAVLAGLISCSPQTREAWVAAVGLLARLRPCQSYRMTCVSFLVRHTLLIADLLL